MAVTKVSKTWCYTLNNYTTEDIEQFKAFTCSKHRCCMETGECGTPHLQGCITFKRGYRLTQLKKINNRVHWEPSKTIDAENYCTKGEIIIDTNNSQQGKRNDIINIKKKLDMGTTMKEIAEEHFETWVRTHKALEKYQELKRLPRTWETEVIVLWGEPGVGKTRKAYESYGGVFVDFREPFFIGDTCSDTIIFDEFDRWGISDFKTLRLFDRYPLKVEVKGGWQEFAPKRIVCTSNKHPKKWPIWCKALERRISHIENVTVTEVL